MSILSVGSAGVVGAPRPSAGRQRARTRLAYLFIAPGLVMLLVFRYYPALSALYHSLTTWDGTSPPIFVGLANFRSFFADPIFGRSVLNVGELTLFWMVQAVTVPLIVAQLILGIKSPRLQFIYRLFFVLPLVVPAVVNILLWQFIYAGDGPLNQVLGALHLNRLEQDWLGNPQTALYAIMAMGFPWVEGVGLLIYTAGLQAIPHEIVEAAHIDGAGAVRMFFAVQIPQIVGQLRLMWVLAIIDGIQSFTRVLILTQGGPGYATTVPALRMYIEAFENQRMGRACAIGTVLFAAILVLTFINLRSIRSRVEYEPDRADLPVQPSGALAGSWRVPDTSDTAGTS
ncbi:MAG TPA: sugar ABC transporter permease [bacterium]|nr:sugar ABC transporter permease [bacterium]